MTTEPKQSLSLAAGAGRSVVELPAAVFPIEGFTGVHDDLEARVVLLEQSGRRIAIVVVDQTSLVVDALARVRAIVADECQVPDDRVIVTVSHTFSAPHIAPRPEGGGRPDDNNERLIEALESAVRSSAVSALASLRPATLGSGSGTSRVAVNRDVSTADGWWLGADGRGLSPDRVSVVSFVDLEGEPIAVLYSASVQPSVMNGSVASDGGRLVTGDLAGASSRHIEAALPGTVAAFLLGAAADQAPLLTAVRGVVDADGAWSEHDAGPSGHLLTTLLGERLGAEVVRVVAETIGNEEAPVVELRRESVTVDGQVAPPREEIRPTRHREFEATGPVDVGVVILRLGDVVFTGVAPELTAVTAAEIEEVSPFATTVVLTMVDGAAKYMADDRSFERVTYEAMSSRFARGSAERLREHLRGSLARLYEAERLPDRR